MCQPWEISNRMQCVSCLEFENVNARFSVTGKGAWLEDNSD